MKKKQTLLCIKNDSVLKLKVGKLYTPDERYYPFGYIIDGIACPSNYFEEVELIDTSECPIDKSLADCTMEELLDEIKRRTKGLNL